MSLQKIILKWYAMEGRDLPWRHTRDPYEILVSEVMLQQTQVSRVLEKWPAFLKKYPTFSKLADAPKGDVIRDWEGMGYNNRVLRLQRLAQTVRDKPLPSDPEELVKLDGIGPYTAHAVCCFSFEQDVPVVDVNIRRIFSRVHHELRFEDEMMPEKGMWNLARELVPKGFGYDWNQALMDFGSLICTARSPKCGVCPASSICKSAGKLVARKKPKKAASNNKIIPDRIYRGRVVQYLRGQEKGKWVTRTMVGKAIREDIAKHGRWFEKILTALEKDGMIEVQRGRSVKIRLP